MQGVGFSVDLEHSLALRLAARLPNYRESETVARCAILGWSQDVCKESRLHVEDERCVVSSYHFLTGLRLIEKKKIEGRPGAWPRAASSRAPP